MSVVSQDRLEAGEAPGRPQPRERPFIGRENTQQQRIALAIRSAPRWGEASTPK